MKEDSEIESRYIGNYCKDCPHTTSDHLEKHKDGKNIRAECTVWSCNCKKFVKGKPIPRGKKRYEIFTEEEMRKQALVLKDAIKRAQLDT